MIDRQKFFEEYRKQFNLKILKKSVVDCVDAILDEHEKQGEKASLPQLAYMFATVRAEVGNDLVPIVENMNYSAKRIIEVWPSRPEAVKFAGNPEGLANSVYGNRLGNGPPESGDGFRYRGRGIGAQFTGKDQYIKWSKITGYDMVATPVLACDLTIGAMILYKGCLEGLFTGVPITKYINDNIKDYVNARRAVNADVPRMGKVIAADAGRFEACLRAAVIRSVSTQPSPEINPPASSMSGWGAFWRAARKLFNP